MKLGFIGCGNMAKAMIEGMLSSAVVDVDDIITSARHQETLIAIKEKLHIHTTQDNTKCAQSDIVILAIKPHQYEAVIKEIKDVISKSTIVISIAPNHSLETLEVMFEKPVKLIRCMPNTPIQVKAGMCALTPNALVSDKELHKIIELFEACGKTMVVSESLSNAVTAVSGSSVAYVFMFIEAMADGAVKQGMPRNMAYTFASQAVYGAAKMVMETGMHPGLLKDMVCSPNGTTIEAVAVLEKRGLRSALIEAMDACTKKANKM